jgi:hypothetical protein
VHFSVAPGGLEGVLELNAEVTWTNRWSVDGEPRTDSSSYTQSHRIRVLRPAAGTPWTISLSVPGEDTATVSEGICPRGCSYGGATSTVAFSGSVRGVP